METSQAPRFTLPGAVVAAVLAFIVTAATLCLAFSQLFLGDWKVWETHATVTSPDVVKLTLAVVAGIAAVQGLVVAYRRQHALETDDSHNLERFRESAILLGSPDPTGRLAGVYAMSTLADDWPRGRQQCADVICGYVRLSFDESTEVHELRSSTSTNVGRNGLETTTRTFEHRPGEAEVRRSITKIISEHLTPHVQTNWCSLELNLDRATLIDANFQGTQLGSFSSRGATYLGETNFRNARFSGSADFSGATFAGDTTFRDARFAQNGHFNRARFDSAARFRGVEIVGRAHFSHTIFEQNANFLKAEFREGGFFSGAHFRLSVSFARAKFGRSSHFKNAIFGRQSYFTRSEVEGDISFLGAELGEHFSFYSTKVSGSALWSPGATPRLTRGKTHPQRPPSGDQKVPADTV